MAGDIVLIQGAQGFLVHRVVATARFPSGERIFHCGDASGRVGICLSAALIGRVVEVCDPPGVALPTLARAGPAVRRRLRHARWRCRLYSLARRLAELTGAARPAGLRRAGSALARRLL